MQRKQGSRFVRNISEHIKPSVKSNKSLVINKNSAHKESLKQVVERESTGALKGQLLRLQYNQRLDKLIDKKDLNLDFFDEEKFMEYMYCDKGQKIKRSSSFRGIKLDDLIGERVLKEKRCDRDNDFDNEIKKLDKLSILNMGARYEFLNANKMVLNLNLELVLVISNQIENA